MTQRRRMLIPPDPSTRMRRPRRSTDPDLDIEIREHPRKPTRVGQARKSGMSEAINRQPPP